MYKPRDQNTREPDVFRPGQKRGEGTKRKRVAKDRRQRKTVTLEEWWRQVTNWRLFSCYIWFFIANVTVFFLYNLIPLLPSIPTSNFILLFGGFCLILFAQYSLTTGTGKLDTARININIFYNYFIFTIKWIEEIIIKLGTKRMYLEQFYYYLSVHFCV